jgi:hypothetical protein
MATEDEFYRVQAKYQDELLARPEVHAVGIGLKRRGGVRTKELAIVCLVKKKLELSELDPEDVIPPSLDGIPTDVQQAPVPTPFGTDPSYLKQQVRPLAGGLQIQVGESNGTLGFIGVLVEEGTVVGVSNQHVLDPDPPPINVGQTVYQPNEAKHEDIGTTTKVVLSPTLDGGYTSLTTAAAPGILKWNEQLQSYETRAVGEVIIHPMDLPYPVWKTGRTTGTTFGEITDMNVTGYRDDDWPYEQQMRIASNDSDPFSEPGDSGSAVVSDDFRIAGLLWGGDDPDKNPPPFSSYASPISFVTEELGVEVAHGDMEQLPEPVVVPSFEELLARLKSDQGKRVASFLIEHVPVISDLIYNDRRVGVIWNRHPFHEFCNAIIENVATKATPLPAEMIGVATKPALEELGAILVKQGSSELDSAIEAVRSDIEWMIGRPYADVAGKG